MFLYLIFSLHIFYGDYEFNNTALDANKFGTMFSFPTEKWWEHYWKFKIMIFTKGGEVIYTCIDLYFIEFRSRNRPFKN